MFAPIYDLICEMMALHGLVFARHETEWRLVMTDDEEAIPEIHDALAKLMQRPGRLSTESWMRLDLCRQRFGWRHIDEYMQ